MILIIIIIVTLFFGFLLSRIPRETDLKKFVFLMSYAFLGIIVGLRDETIGKDTLTYYINFEDISVAPFSGIWDATAMEPGFVLLNKLASNIGFDYFSFQLFLSVIMFLLFGNFLYHNTKDLFTSTIIFLGAGYFAFTINIMRQMMAIAICANSWTYICNQRYLPAFGIVIIGSFFHLTTALYIIPLLLYILRNNRLILYSFTGGILCLGALLPKIFAVLQEYEIYAGYADMNNNGLQGGIIYILWIVEISLIFYVLLNKKFNVVQKIISNLALFCTVLAMLDEKVRYLDRVGLVFFPFVILLFCIVGDSIRKQKLKELYFIGCNLFFLLFFCYRDTEFWEFSTFI